MNHSLGSLSWQEMVVRIGLAFCAGLVIGLERETHGRAAGLRTTILAGTAAALAMILSEYLFVISVPPGGGWRPDPARLGAASSPASDSLARARSSGRRTSCVV